MELQQRRGGIRKEGVTEEDTSNRKGEMKGICKQTKMKERN